MKNRSNLKYLFVKTCVFSGMFLSGSLLFSQEGGPMDILPREEIVRMQVEALMTEDVIMMQEVFHEDVEIIMFPMVELAKGKEESIAFWKARFEKTGKGHDLRNTTIVGNHYVTQIKRTDPNAPEDMVVIIYTFEEKKIKRMTLIEP